MTGTAIGSVPTRPVSPGLRLAVLLIVPAAVIACALMLKAAAGSYWRHPSFEPEYWYLLNALSVAWGKQAVYCDHPGATLHLMGGAVIRITHWIGSRGPLPDDCLLRPEQYLFALHISFLALYAAALGAAGWVVSTATGRWSDGVLVQLGAILPLCALVALQHVSPEVVLLTLAVLLGAVSLRQVVCPVAKQWWWAPALLSGGLLGLGVATKVTFLPLTLLPLAALPGWRARVLFLPVAVGVFLLLILNPFVSTAWFFKFIASILTHTGQYGHGDSGFLPPGVLATNLRNWALQALLTEWVALLVVLGSGVALMLAWRGGGDAGEGVRRRVAWLLVAVLAAQAGQFAMAVKSPATHMRYLAPALGLVGVNAVLALSLWRGLALSRRGAALARWAMPVLLMLVVAQAVRIGLYRAVQASETRVTQEFLELLGQRTHGCRVVCFYPSSSPTYALLSGNDSAGWVWGEDLDRLYPDRIFYYVDTNQFHDFMRRVHPPEEVLSGNACVVLQGVSTDAMKKNPGLELLVPGNGERAYRIRRR